MEVRAKRKGKSYTIRKSKPKAPAPIRDTSIRDDPRPATEPVKATKAPAQPVGKPEEAAKVEQPPEKDPGGGWERLLSIFNLELSILWTRLNPLEKFAVVEALEGMVRNIRMDHPREMKLGEEERRRRQEKEKAEKAREAKNKPGPKKILATLPSSRCGEIASTRDTPEIETPAAAEKVRG